MAEVTRCANCGARIFALQLKSGTRIELNATPDPNGVWAIVKGDPVPAVVFDRGRVIGRLERFKNAELFSGHYGKVCADASAARAEGIGKKTGS